MRHHILFIICLSFFLLDSLAGQAQDTENKASARLLEQAERVLYTSPQQAAYYASEARKAANTGEAQVHALYTYAMAERLQGNFDNSIQALYEAEELLPSGKAEQKGHLYNLMGLNYCNLGDYNKAITFSNDAISCFKTAQDSVDLARCYNNRGIIHCHINEFRQADYFLNKALEINRSTKDLKQIAANLNNLCLYEGDVDKQLEWINEAIVINKNLHATWSLSENYNNLGRLYYYAHRYPEAIAALEKAYRLANELGAKGIICDNYEYSAMVYSAIGDYKEAYRKQSELYALSKEIQSVNKLRTMEQRIAQEKLSALRQKETLRQQEYEISLLQRNIIMILTVAVLLTAIGFLLLQRYRRKKKIQLLDAQYRIEQSEHEIAKLKMQQQQSDLEHARLALETSKQEATNFAVFLQSRNEVLDKIQEQVREGYRMEQRELVAHLKKINAYIRQYQATNKNNSMMMQTIDDKMKEFLARLEERHPNLTQGEKHLAGLLRVNLSTKEISMMTGNTPKTINMNRYRLRKALDLPAEADLVTYIQSI